ncbi:metalloreductase transmembrane component [Blastomyces gilchristii SLH14081]|uniref:ferric-chelate reductase (NADPH) n=1 Tax=Blastomyces gilchristii (strain SLH14081) TaxID=559298 RepID=A0A179UUD8_BLAGS|nr:metalloreductase transmembrane component [Blastomyces gilchristii SLH14081]OAT11423.1 metalloreductase transmembrane component [Blastomyces gilchristii SLH14081]
MSPLNRLKDSSGVFPRGLESLVSLAKRISIPPDVHQSPIEIEESQRDPWAESGKYALGWVYFSIILLIATTLLYLYNVWCDKIRTGLYKEEVLNNKTSSPQSDFEMTSPGTANSSRNFFPPEGPLPSTTPRRQESSISNLWLINYLTAFIRWLVYRPIPVIRIWKLKIVPPSMGATVIVLMALIFVTLYCFIPQPLFYSSIRAGSPPLAIRAGMIAVALMPWIIALSSKANLISLMTGIGHERLNVLHRWGGYLCLFLSLVHMIPFYITPVWENDGLEIYEKLRTGNLYIYASGLAAFAPLCFLCVHSLPLLRNRLYELFVTLHAPVSVIFLGMLFWHCKNFLTSWHYLFSTVAIWVVSYFARLFFLNWTNPFRLSWLIGEESAVTILPETAVKVTVPTQMKWRPGQYVYLRMPGISFFENHPFTVASLCSDDFPSEYGEEYRDMTLVFRPFSGFTGKVLDTALEKGPYKTYRAFIDGPYGGMRREIASFDDVVFFAGGSGITAIASQLLDLIKRMRDGKALTRTVRVIWALKRPETLEWFKEELRICREYAPPGSVLCQFYLTAAKRYDGTTMTRSRPHSTVLHDRINDVFQGVASKRNSAYIREEAGGDSEREKELRRENEDGVAALPPAHLHEHHQNYHHSRSQGPEIIAPVPIPSPAHPFPSFPFSHPDYFNQQHQHQHQHQQRDIEDPRSFDFGFPSTPTLFQKNLMRFAFLPTQKRDGWRTEYGRPDIPFILRQFSKEFGRRTCVFVCGPPSMRTDVARTVAQLQRVVMKDPGRDELYLHTENYAI